MEANLIVGKNESLLAQTESNNPPSAEERLLHNIKALGDGVIINVCALLSNTNVSVLTKEYNAYLKKQDIDIGFNLFELISDHYYRETFHSDILNALLDPDGKHLEKDGFLKLFLFYIKNEHGANIDLNHYEKARVAKEEGRIDILIKGCGHAIIIENKINGAPDMHQQLPRYLELVESDKSVTCDAIVYLRLNAISGPDTSTWTRKQAEDVNKRLVIIQAYDARVETETDLLKGWILKCQKLAVNNPDPLHVLRQYGNIIKKLGCKAMNKPIMEKFYKIIINENGEQFKTALSLKSMLDDLPQYRQERIREFFSSNSAPFQKPNLAANEGVNFDAQLEGVRYRMAVWVHPEHYLLTFHDLNDANGLNKNAEKILYKLGLIDVFSPNPDPGQAGMLIKSFNFPSEEQTLIDFILAFKTKLGELAP